jgi:hypothetical protein
VCPSGGFRANGLAIDEFDATAEVFGKLFPHLDGDRFGLEVLLLGPLED